MGVESIKTSDIPYSRYGNSDERPALTWGKIGSVPEEILTCGRSLPALSRQGGGGLSALSPALLLDDDLDPPVLSSPRFSIV